MDDLPPLRDRIRPGVRVLFVGINPGIRSAQIGHHFAGYSNRFWKLLFDSGLVPEPIRAEDDDRLPEWGFGITNLVPRATSGIGDLRAADYEMGRRRLLGVIRRCHPDMVALVGVTLYRVLFDDSAGSRRSVAGDAGSRAGAAGKSASASSAAGARETSPVGLRDARLVGVPVFVLPNPSGRNANFSYEEMLEAFRALGERLQALSS